MKRIYHFIALGMLMCILEKNLKAQQPVDTNHSLDIKLQHVVTIAANTAKGNQVELKKALNNGMDGGLTINEIKEVLVQLYAYAGFPRSLNGLHTYMEVLKERKAKGINDPLGKEPSPLPPGKSRLQFGTEMQTKLIGRPVTGEVYQFAPAIDIFLKEHLFGAIFGRDNLDWKTREVATISALASLGGAENQLRSHFNVGLNTGLTESQLLAIVKVLQEKVGSKEGNTARQVLELVLNKKIPGNENSVTVQSNSQTIFPKGTRITNKNFTGPVWLQMLLDNDSTFNTTMGHVTFEPQSRTNWHYHPGGQILLITGGKGRYQEKGKAIIEIMAGSVIKCQPGVIHWHGASPDTELSHIAIGPNQDRGAVVWLEPVSDVEYNNIKIQKQ